MKRLILLLFVLVALDSTAQTKILHYTETSGYDHNTRSVSLQMMQAVASVNGWLVVDDQTGDEFNSLSNLQEYDVVVFSNTSGDAILDPSQRTNFEAYITGGGSYLGIHAASDTYRHSSANGSNTGTWDFYAELIGASVQQSPNHVSGTPLYSMDVIGNHSSTANLPDPWDKNEEYYYWENGYFGLENIAVLEVEETVGPNNQVNSYDAERPMSWYKELPAGGKMFYTALGHASSNFTSDQNFVNHIEDALIWIVSTTTSINEQLIENPIQVSRTNGRITVYVNLKVPETVHLYNSLGQSILHLSNTYQLNTEMLPTGIYLLEALQGDKVYREKLYLSSVTQ